MNALYNNNNLLNKLNSIEQDNHILSTPGSPYATSGSSNTSESGDTYESPYPSSGSESGDAIDSPHITAKKVGDLSNVLFYTDSQNTYLQSLTLLGSDGNPLPGFEFHTNKFTYVDISVHKQVESISIQAQKIDEYSTISYDSSVVGNQMDLNIGENVLKIIVTDSSQNETCYTIYIQRLPTTFYDWSSYTDESIEALREAFVKYLYEQFGSSKEFLADTQALPTKFDYTKSKVALFSTPHHTEFDLDVHNNKGYYAYIEEGNAFIVISGGTQFEFTRSDDKYDVTYHSAGKRNYFHNVKKRDKHSIHLFRDAKPITFRYAIGSSEGDTNDNEEHSDEPLYPVCILEGQKVLLDKGWTLIQDITTNDTINGMKVLFVQKQNISQPIIRFPKGCFGVNTPNEDLYMTHDHIVYDPIQKKLTNAGMMTYEYDTVQECENPPYTSVYSLLLQKWCLLNVNNVKCESLCPTSDIALGHYSRQHIFSSLKELAFISSYKDIQTTNDIYVQNDMICSKKNNTLHISSVC